MIQPGQDEHERGQKRRDAHDWATLIVITFTLIAAGIAAGCAAGFTGWQAWIARDQEHRALRAYVVLNAELVQERDARPPCIKLTAENMGLTPAYDLVFVPWATAIKISDTVPEGVRTMQTMQCINQPMPGEIVDRGHTFSKSYTFGAAIMSNGDPMSRLSDAFGGDRKIIAYGLACYRDVFRQIHTIRLCLEWFSLTVGPDKCPHEDEDED
jgi:hypothetical protein